MKIYSVNYDFQEIDIPLSVFLHSFWEAFLRDNSPILTDAIHQFLVLGSDDGGYGWSVVSASDFALIQRLLAREGRAVLAATGALREENRPSE